jgi:nitroreductase
MELKQVILGRRAVREYTDQAVDDRMILHIVRDAVQAPSAVNQQPWLFTVVRDQAILNTILKKSKAHMLVTMSPDGSDDHFKGHLESADFQIFYHAPALIVISAAQQDRWHTEDCALAAENLMLSAFEAGLGSCWIGFAQGYLSTHECKSLLGIADGAMPVAPIIVGYARHDPPAVARKEPVIHWL